MTAAPLSWIKEIHHALIESKQIPLFGSSPAFPWQEFSNQISSLFQAEFNIYPRLTQILKSDEITAGFGGGIISIALDLTPLTHQVFWIMGKEDMARLTTFALKLPNENKGFSSAKYQEGFYYFLTTRAVQIIDELQAFGDLNPKIAKTALLPQEGALCIDIEIQHPKHTIWGRLVCPLSFHQEFKTHFSTRAPAPLMNELTKQIDVPLKVEIGDTSLSLDEWKQVSIGDFILLDRCTYDPMTHKGTAVLTLHQTPLLRVRMKENHLKIVDYAFYHEEKNQMSPYEPQDEENNEKLFDAEDQSSSDESSELGSDENHLWASQEIEKTYEKMIPVSDIPLTLTVEVARLQVNLDKLLQLSPGNVLELPVMPEQGVDLTIGGKQVAKAELIKLGEMLGVKILQIMK